VRSRVREWLAHHRHRYSDWPDLVLPEFEWLRELGLTEVTVERYLTGSSVRFAGGGFGLLVGEEIEAGLGISGYLSRRGDDDDARSLTWLLEHHRPGRDRIDLGPRDRTALAAATRELSIALADLVPTVIAIERAGGSPGERRRAERSPAGLGGADDDPRRGGRWEWLTGVGPPRSGTRPRP
jgi:hypothetical protein